MGAGGDPGAAAHVREALGEDPSRPGKAGHEQVRRRPFASHRVKERRREAGPDDEHRPAGLVDDSRDEVVFAGALADPPAEPGASVEPPAARVTIAVARPLERQRHPRDLCELVADARAVGLEALFAALPTAVGEEARDLRPGHRLEPLGVDAPLAHRRGAPRHGRLAAAQRRGDLVPAHPPFRSWRIISFLLVMDAPF